MGTLAKAHAKRAQIYEKACSALANPLDAPSLSGPEQDAYAIIQTKEGGTRAAARVAEGAEVGFRVMAIKAAEGADFVKARVIHENSQLEEQRIMRNPCA